MHTHRLLPVAVALLLSATAAAQGPPQTARVVPYPIDLPNGFQRAVGQGTRTLLGLPGEKHWTNYARYDIALTVDPANSRVQGTAKMTYENRSPDELDRLIVHCYQDMMKAGTQRTRFVTATNGLEIGEVKIGDDTVRARAGHQAADPAARAARVRREGHRDDRLRL